MKLVIFCLLLHAIQFAHCRSLNELISELLRLKFPSKLEPSMFENELVDEDGVDGLLMFLAFIQTLMNNVSKKIQIITKKVCLIKTLKLSLYNYVKIQQNLMHFCTFLQ